MFAENETATMNATVGRPEESSILQFGEEKKEAATLPAVNVLSNEGLKTKYGKLYQVEVVVDQDDENEGRKLSFMFKAPSTASFNRYMKFASKNMAAATVVFVEDNVIDEQREALKKEWENYPGLALNIGQKLLAIIGLGDNINFRKL